MRRVLDSLDRARKLLGGGKAASGPVDTAAGQYNSPLPPPQPVTLPAPPPPPSPDPLTAGSIHRLITNELDMSHLYVQSALDLDR